LKLKLVGESLRFQQLNGVPESKGANESVHMGFSPASLKGTESGMLYTCHTIMMTTFMEAKEQIHVYTMF
jgi:hypothetical protein